MANVMGKVIASFPASVWDGSTGTRLNDPLLYDSIPSKEDYDRVVAEIIALQNYVLSNVIPTNTPAFTSFLISGVSTSLEVGDTISSASYTFTWTDTFPDSIAHDSISIDDTTNTTNLGSSIADTGSQSLPIPNDITYGLSATNTFTISAINFLDNLFSKTLSIHWMFKVYYGTSSSTTLDETAIKALTSNPLRSGFAGTYALGAGDYKYFCFPDSYGSPTLFKNSLNNFPIDMAQSTDDPFYENIANGYYYGLVPVTNGNNVTENYRVYRSHFTLGGSTGISVS